MRTCRLCLLLSSFFIACQPGNPPVTAHDNAEFKLEEGFEIQLVASEPLLEDPVDMEIDESGNMYVVEMTGNPSNHSGAGKIKLLADTNNDGVMDRSFVFASGLRMPGGVMRWKKGIIVTDPPKVLYFEDQNGDHVADSSSVMLTGFDSTDLESNVNNPYYGLDNWIYVGNGGETGPGIRFASGEGPLLPNNANGQRVRFRPETNELEALSGNTQFGHTEDMAGHGLLVNNSVHIYEEVIAAKYLNRNPGLPVSSATQEIADHSAEVYPTTVNPENQLLTDAGVFTAACGITAYLGGAFGKEYDSMVFVAEPAHNLVHVDKLSAAGTVHKASRQHAAKEFLTSTDPWFRPVNFYIGPGGELYLVDYYRQFIEGPAFMAEEVLKTANLYNGSDKGRIYRITKKSSPGNLSLPSTLTNAMLLEKIADKNIWWRKTAQRLLIDRKALETTGVLKNIVLASGAPAGKVHALWTLEGLHQLSPDIILHALRDSANEVRENAIRLAELYFAEDAAVSAYLFNMYDDPDPRVRLQLTCTVGELKNPAAEGFIERMLFKYIDDPWMQIAALTSSARHQQKLLATALKKYGDRPLLIERLAGMITSTGTPKEIISLLKEAISNNDPSQAAVLRGMAASLSGNKSAYKSLRDQQPLLVKAVLNHPSNEIRQECLQILKVTGINRNNALNVQVHQATLIAMADTVNAAKRSGAVQLLGLAQPESHVDLFTRLIQSNHPVSVQLAAINALSAIPGTRPSQLMLEKWNTLTPEIKDEAINTFFTGRDRVSILLEAIGRNQVPASLIGWPRSVRLMAGRWPKSTETAADSMLVKKARALLSRKETPKKDIIRQYAAGMDKGAGDQGKKIFSENCGICHQVNNTQGIKLGPDLSTVRNWNPVELITKILDPNQSVKGGYELWDITLADGTELQGIISSESPSAITINNVNSLPRIVSRKNIRSISSSGMTIMPTEFEKQISQTEMASLIAFLKNE